MHTPASGSSRVILLASGVWSHNLTEKITYPREHIAWHWHKIIETTSPQSGNFVPATLGPPKLWYYCSYTDHQSWGCKMKRKKKFNTSMDLPKGWGESPVPASIQLLYETAVPQEALAPSPAPLGVHQWPSSCSSSAQHQNHTMTKLKL